MPSPGLLYTRNPLGERIDFHDGPIRHIIVHRADAQMFVSFRNAGKDSERMISDLAHVLMILDTSKENPDNG